MTIMNAAVVAQEKLVRMLHEMGESRAALSHGLPGVYPCLENKHLQAWFRPNVADTGNF